MTQRVNRLFYKKRISFNFQIETTFLSTVHVILMFSLIFLIAILGSSLTTRTLNTYEHFHNNNNHQTSLIEKIPIIQLNVYILQ